MNLSCRPLSQSSSVRCSITPPAAEPALLTMMSIRPSALWPAQMATSTPSCASAKAIPLPMPSLPPVTSAVLPCNLRSIAFSLSLSPADEPDQKQDPAKSKRHALRFEHPLHQAFEPLWGDRKFGNRSFDAQGIVDRGGDGGPDR